MALILGIETSCDETAAAVVRSGERVISNIVSSQYAVHRPYGGVVPELASREHLRNIVPVVRAALEAAKIDYVGIDALAVTQGPGLAGALLVGVSYAKALAFAVGKPLIAVNHLEGHIHAVLLERLQQARSAASVEGADAAAEDGLRFPVLALVVSGGHTHLYLAERDGESWTYRNIGKTRDDAAGEAFDKVAVLRYVETHAMQPQIEARRSALAAVANPKPDDYLALCDRQTLDLVASFQRAVVEDLVVKTLAAAQAYEVETLFVTGGVAANRELRATFEESAMRAGLPVSFPSRPLSTDNAAMIAAAAYPRFLARDFASGDFS